jgi:phosphoglycolate phosphatase
MKASSSDALLEVEAIAFDLDGTLLDTVHDLAAACNALLAELEYPPLPLEVIRTMIGKGMGNLVARMLAVSTGESHEAIDARASTDALRRYQAHYAVLHGRATRPFPGTIEGLVRLSSLGIPLAVITNKATQFVRSHLAQAGIEHFFAIVIGGDDLPTRKPDPGPLFHVANFFGIAPARLLMVGDSANDVQAARAAGCPVLIVPYGYNEGNSVHELDVDGIVRTVEAVADRIRFVAPTPQ